ncbi:MAG: rhamnulokinase [Actinobacteria bacterium HGW-Actinobacteria-4]|nr:MAG: rhamnulokinase [Actinobacteria bacterium HGW-Actinobacteria-4]
MSASVAAVDLGATSGRVMVGVVGPNTLQIQQIARFPNSPVRTPAGLQWNTMELYSRVLDGLRQAAQHGTQVSSVGVDSWGVDYGLLSGDRVLESPFHYRDERTARGVAAVHARVPHEALYRLNGLQYLPFNTLYQLAADDPAVLAIVDTALLIPDLMNFYLTGHRFAERTNASTTGLLNIATHEWDTELIDLLGLRRTMFPPLVGAGDELGELLPHVLDFTGLASDTKVLAVGSHDTASAVVATPMHEPDGAYISCGTWGLVGVETEKPILSDAARAANFTNEGGVDGRTRFLHNVMGLWLLSECVREWERDGKPVTMEHLIAEAASLQTEVPLVDANDPTFLARGDMPTRIAAWCTEHNLPAPQSRAEFVRCVIESLAAAFAEAVRSASTLSGQTVTRIHIVGGGALNTLLCQRIADRARLRVVAGPVEATAIGNVLIQGRALGAVSGTLESLRALVDASFSPTVYMPEGSA